MAEFWVMATVDGHREEVGVYRGPNGLEEALAMCFMLDSLEPGCDARVQFRIGS